MIYYTRGAGSQLAPVDLAHNVPALRHRVLNLIGTINGTLIVQGWIKLHRTITQNQLWLVDPFSRGQAWVDLLLQANHSPGYFRTANGARVDVDRGQCGMSQLTMSKRWKWSRGKVKRFLKELEKDGNICLQTVQRNTVLTICNYSKYQDESSSMVQQTDNKQDNKQDNKRGTNKNVKNVNNEKKINFTQMSDEKILKTATEKGIKTHGLSRYDLINKLYNHRSTEDLRP